MKISTCCDAEVFTAKYWDVNKEIQVYVCSQCKRECGCFDTYIEENKDDNKQDTKQLWRP